MWWRRKPEDFESELDAHLELEAEALRADGLSEEDAQTTARRALGNRTTTQERFYESSHWMFGQHLLRDLRFAGRVLSKEPKFSVLTILGLALGIGVSTALFAFFNVTIQFGGTGIRLMDEVVNPATYLSINRTAAIYHETDFSFPEYRYFQNHATAVEEISAESETSNLILGAVSNAIDAEQVGARFESAGFLSVRGFQPALGRTFSIAEEQAGSPVALLSRRLWQERFAEDPGILGKTVLLNNHAVTIIGIADARMHATLPFIFLPLGLQPLLLDRVGDLPRDSEKGWLMINARLQPHLTLAQAQAEADLIANAFARTKAPAPEPTDASQAAKRVSVFQGILPPSIRRQSAEAKLGVALAISMILLIACSNLASLLLARATVRRRELGVRLSLGASRARLICQLLTESLLLSITGGALGILFSAWLAQWLFLAMRSQSGLEYRFDNNVLLYGLLLSIVTGFSFGLGPALAATRTDLARALHAEGLSGAPSSPVGSFWSRRNLLVVIPLALSLMLLIGAALLVRTAGNSRAVSTSFDTSRLIGMSFRLKEQGYDQVKSAQFQQALRDRIGALPGVASVAWSDFLPPLMGRCRIQTAQADGNGSAMPAGGDPGCDLVSAGFFETLGVPILRGREFLPSDREGSVPVAVVSQAFARKYWPDQNPLGQRIRSDSGSAFFEVVGVAADLDDSTHPGMIAVPSTVYVPFSQSPLWSSANQDSGAYLFSQPVDLGQFIVRASGDPKPVKTALRQVVRAADPSLWVNIVTIEESLDRITGSVRPALLVVSGLGALVLLMAAAGIYALLAYSVSQRTREIGIRMALGAHRREILSLVMRQTLILIACGIAFGLLGALALGRILASLVLRTSPPDLVTCVLVAVLLAGVSLLASYLPARKALRVNPVEALRCD